MKNKNTVLFILICIIISAGCASGPKYVPVDNANPGKAILYIYRPAHFGAAANSPKVEIDGKQWFYLPNGGYTWFELESGDHVIKFSFGYDQSKSFKASAGRSYFLRWLPFVSATNLTPAGPYIAFDGNAVIFNERDALNEIRECRRIDPSYIMTRD